MVDVEANSQNGQYEPKSLIGRALLRKSVSSQVIFWIISICLLTRGFHESYLILDATAESFNSAFHKYELIYEQLYSVSFCLIILHFKSDKSLYIKYLDIYRTIVTNNFGLAATGFLRKSVKTYKIFLIIALIYETITTFVNDHLYSLPVQGGSYNSYFRVILVTIAQYGYVFVTQFVIECCIYSQSSFIPINNLLDSLLTQKIQLTPNSTNNPAKSIRLSYNKTVQSIRYMDKYFMYFNLIFYLYFTGHCILIVGDILDGNRSFFFKLWTIFRFLGESSYIASITYHLVSVNQKSVNIFDKVYQISFSLNSSHSIETMNEINLFLLRTNRNDVGFTFAGICMISRSFVSSLATISLTLGLALPSFIK